MANESLDEFDDTSFEKRLETLKDTQDSIQSMSAWCLHRRLQHKKIVCCWLNVFKRVRVEQRLTLFHLANDVIQYSKRKRYEFVESWATALQRATTMVRDEKVKGKILRIFQIWEQREIYNEEYLSDLCGLLNIKTAKKTESVPDQNVDSSQDEFQISTVINNIRECVQLSETTDKSFKKLPKPPICDTENFKQQLKDKSHSSEKASEIECYISCVQSIIKTLETEIKSRKMVVSDTEKTIAFYAKQNHEVKVISNAYKKFSNRVDNVKKKLEEMMPALPSPIPSPDINAPSPEPDADIQLPDEQTHMSINIFKTGINGYSSYLDGNLPFDINDFKSDDISSKAPSQQPIEVIGSRADDESFNTSSEYYKPESINVYSNDTTIPIPGLNPMPVPPVQSGYTSLARSAQQYNDMLPQQNTTPFGTINTSYSTSVASTYYETNSSYHSNTNNGNSGPSLQQYMPPPPMPPSSLTGNFEQESSSVDPFNSSWDGNIPWPPLNNSNAPSAPYSQSTVDGPVSPRNNDSNRLEYSGHSSSLLSPQDVDHRQLHMPTFNMGAKLTLGKDKARQLDIDHRNLISLTGSPGINDNEKKSWTAQNENEFKTNTSGDVDYRTSLGPLVISNTIGMEPSSSSPSSKIPVMSISNLAKNSTSPLKSNASSSSESQKEDVTSGGGRYDPTDMVIDMDMSDEDIDELLKEAQNQQRDQYNSLQTTTTEDVSMKPPNECIENLQLRSGLLETPNDYMQQNIWDTNSMQPPLYTSPQQQQDQQAWNQVDSSRWNGGDNIGRAPPPPRPPFPLSFQYPNNNFEYGNESGPVGMGSPSVRGRGWSTPPNHFRNFPRYRGSQFFNRGGGNIRARPPFRGKYRGNNPWI